MDHLLLVGLFVCTLCVLALNSAETEHRSYIEQSQLSGDSETGSGSDAVIGTLPDSCTDEYRSETDHTMCLWDDDKVVWSGISITQRDEIVNFHNEVRARVQPPATDLTKLIWDDVLASVAKKWAKQCILDHDKNRNIPSYGMSIGQNVAAGHWNWSHAMLSWFQEVDVYSYGQDADDYLGPGGWYKIGHYTQLVHNSTSRLGCGYAECRGTSYTSFYVCNYARGQSRTAYPYTRGERCEACPGSCSQGLCDCNGKLCLNEGQLNIDSCWCKCPRIYKGDDCSQLNCPESDAPYCRLDLLPPDCQVYSNVPHLCPYMCGLCGNGKISGDRTTKSNLSRTNIATTISPVFISVFNCTYTDYRPSAGQCKLYGDEGQDTLFCKSHGGQFSCVDCERYVNVKTAYCPVMCGLCEAPCGGKLCQNSGRLDPATCQCRCKKPFTGNTCEILTCPQADKWHCRFFGEEYCYSYTIIPFDCPFLCGICD